MELLPLLQGLSTPVLIIVGVMSYRGLTAWHDIDKRLAIIESHFNLEKKA